jgi:hypothetical protein
MGNEKKKRAKKRLYEYAVVYNPTEGDAEAEVIDKGQMLADKPDGVLRKLIRKVDDKWEDRLDDIDFFIRDFQ